MKTINFAFIIWVLSLFFISGCKNAANQNQDNNPKDSANKPAMCKVEVYNIHRSHCSATCVAVGDISKNAVGKFFKDQVDKGAVKFMDLNLDDAANASLAKKLEAKDSGLIILSRLADGKEQLEDITDFAYTTALNEPAMLTEGIKTKVGEKLH